MDSSAHASPGSWVQRWLPVFVLLALACLVRLPLFSEPPGRDQGLFMTQASLVLEGRSLYSEVWEHKPPGVMGIYVVASALGGEDYRAVQVAHGLAAFLTALALWGVATRSGLGRVAATAAGVFYLLFHGGPLFGGFWSTAQVEIFVDPLLALALFLVVPGRKGQPTPDASWLVAGICIGIAMAWLKYSCFPLLGLGLLVFLDPARSSRGRALSKLAFFIAGAIIPGALLIFYFAVTGRIEDFWSATVIFNLAHREVGAFSGDATFWMQVFPWLAPLALLYGLSAAGVLIVATGRPFSGGPRWLLAAALWVWGMTLAEVFIQGKFWIYHYHVILLPLCLLAALGVRGIAVMLAPRVGGVIAWTICGIFGLLLLSPYASVWWEYAEHHGLTGASRDAAVRETYRWGDGDFSVVENDRIASQLAAATAPDDAIFVWGFEPSLYRLSGRQPASRFLYDYPLLPSLGAIAARHEEQLIRDLETSSPVLFVVVRGDRNDLENTDSETQLQDHPQLAGYLARFYRPAWVEGDFRVYRRLD